LALKFFDCSKERGDALTFAEEHHQVVRMQRRREEPQKPLPTGVVQQTRKRQEMKVYTETEAVGSTHFKSVYSMWELYPPNNLQMD
jgi:hypothetical protein